MQNPAEASLQLLAIFVVISLGVVLGLRRWAPGRRGIALSLAILFGPAGHLYMKGGIRYILLMYAAWVGLLVATPLPPVVSAMLLTVLSVLLMNVRLGRGKTESESKN